MNDEGELSFRDWAQKLPLAPGKANVRVGDKVFSYKVEKEPDLVFERRAKIVPPKKDK